jgi:group I intron endonuclease
LKKQKIVGIYLIRNIVSERVYVGSSFNIYERWEEHQISWKDGSCNKRFKNSINLHGTGVFQFEILEELSKTISAREIEKIETSWISIFDATSEKGYNVRKLAWSNQGNRHTPEAILKCSIAGKRGMIKRSRKNILYHLDGSFFRVCENLQEAKTFTIKGDTQESINNPSHKCGIYLIYHYTENYPLQVEGYVPIKNQEYRLKISF